MKHDEYCSKLLSVFELLLAVDTVSDIICEAFQYDFSQSVFFSQWHCLQHQCESHNQTHVVVNSDSFE